MCVRTCVHVCFVLILPLSNLTSILFTVSRIIAELSSLPPPSNARTSCCRTAVGPLKYRIRFIAVQTALQMKAQASSGGFGGKDSRVFHFPRRIPTDGHRPLDLCAGTSDASGCSSHQSKRVLLPCYLDWPPFSGADTLGPFSTVKFSIGLSRVVPGGAGGGVMGRP